MRSSPPESSIWLVGPFFMPRAQPVRIPERRGGRGGHRRAAFEQKRRKLRKPAGVGSDTSDARPYRAV